MVVGIIVPFTVAGSIIISSLHARVTMIAFSVIVAVMTRATITTKVPTKFMTILAARLTTRLAGRLVGISRIATTTTLIIKGMGTIKGTTPEILCT
jgi:hypothetical protein